MTILALVYKSFSVNFRIWKVEREALREEKKNVEREAMVVINTELLKLFERDQT